MTHEEITLVIESLYSHKYSKATISNIAEAINEDVKAFKNAQLKENYFCVFLDSTYIPVRRNSVQKEAANIAVGINKVGQKHVLAFTITSQESANVYAEILKDLKKTRNEKSKNICY